MKISEITKDDETKQVYVLFRCQTIDDLKQIARKVSFDQKTDVSYNDVIRTFVEMQLEQSIGKASRAAE